MNWEQIGIVCGGITALLAVAGWVFKRLIPAIRNFSRLLDRIHGVPENKKTGQDEIPSLWENLDHVISELKIIKHEVEFNNGSSVKDAVVRNENMTKELAQEFRDYIARNGSPVTPSVTIHATGVAS